MLKSSIHIDKKRGLNGTWTQFRNNFPLATVTLSPSGHDDFQVDIISSVVPCMYYDEETRGGLLSRSQTASDVSML